jgi:hypothetical protein
MYENNYPSKRYRHTLEFLKKHIDPQESILDLGVANPFSEIMKAEGYQVENTKGEDLDLDFNTVADSDAEVVTAFEIFEHMVAPFNVLQKIKARKLVASIPLRLWFAPAYRSKTAITTNLKIGSSIGCSKKPDGPSKIQPNGQIRQKR